VWDPGTAFRRLFDREHDPDSDSEKSDPDAGLRVDSFPKSLNLGLAPQAIPFGPFQGQGRSKEDLLFFRPGRTEGSRFATQIRIASAMLAAQAPSHS
jgi:hypothetical protein